MDDSEEKDKDASSGMSKFYERLINDGIAGGKRTIQGTQKTLLNSIDRTIPYRVIILDNIFASKGQATQTRLLREWANFIGDNLKIPVLSLNEIRSKYKFGLRAFIRMAVFAVFTSLIVFTTFTFDKQILLFLSREGFGWRILATISVFIFVPVFAYVYSTVTGLFLKMIKFD
jgi:hypothetical protein